ncbi:SRPBCC family protein [Citrobacter youngae]|uniref:SRPBCC family protein n=1 Tax=Citrobacter youngae TaxID=133448 RepID=UPI00139AE0F5|nr:SRPBCC family protein [Citrobacter youngae]
MASVNYNALIEVDAEVVWQTLKAFGQIAKWHPAISKSWMEDNQPDGLPGSTRHLALIDGSILRETLLSMDENLLQLSYCFAASPLPVDNYVAGLRIIPLSDVPQAVIQWSATFDTREPDPDGKMINVIRELIVGGHSSLQEHLQQLNHH